MVRCGKFVLMNVYVGCFAVGAKKQKECKKAKKPRRYKHSKNTLPGIPINHNVCLVAFQSCAKVIEQGERHTKQKQPDLIPLFSVRCALHSAQHHGLSQGGHPSGALCSGSKHGSLASTAHAVEGEVGTAIAAPQQLPNRLPCSLCMCSKSWWMRQRATWSSPPWTC